MAVLLLFTLASALVAFAFWRSARADSDSRRAASAGCILSIVGLFALGSVWPSVFTLAAAFSLPAVFVLGWSFFMPVVLDRPLVNLYTRIAVLLPPLAFVFQAWWLRGGCEAVGKCA